MTKITTPRTKEWKKGLSLLLTLVMVCGYVGLFVGLFAPKAEATSGGNYYVKVYWNVKDDSNKGDNNWSLWYRDQDGTEQWYNYTSNAASSTGDKNSGVITLSGIPTKIWYQLHNSGGAWIGSSEWYINKIEISTNSDMSGAITLWEGKLGCYCANVLAQTINVTYNIAENTQGSWSNSAGQSKTQSTTTWASNYFYSSSSADYGGQGVFSGI